MHQPDGGAPRGQRSRAREKRAGDEFFACSRVAFFGGSFDPPHLGHLAIARAARDAFRLDAVLFAPVGAQPLKPEGPAASFEDRLAMTRLAIEGERGFELSLADAPVASAEQGILPNYTIDTLGSLRSALAPGCALYCLMGADSFFGLRRWHRAAEVPFAAGLIVASRPGQPLERLWSALPEGLILESVPEGDRTESGVEVRAFSLVNPAGQRAPFYVMPDLDVEISASEIRSRVHAAAIGSTTAHLLAAPVAEYIHSHQLYR